MMAVLESKVLERILYSCLLTLIKSNPSFMAAFDPFDWLLWFLVGRNNDCFLPDQTSHPEFSDAQ